MLNFTSLFATLNQQCVGISLFNFNIGPTFTNDMFICNIAPTLQQCVGISLFNFNIAPTLTNNMFICNIALTLKQCVRIALFNFNIGPTLTNDMFICNIAPTLQQCVGISLFNFNIGPILTNNKWGGGVVAAIFRYLQFQNLLFTLDTAKIRISCCKIKYHSNCPDSVRFCNISVRPGDQE